MRVSGYFIAGLVALGTQVVAQPAYQPASSTPTQPTDASTVTRTGDLSPAMMKARADEKLEHMQAQFREVSYARSEARRADDYIKLNCVDSNAIVMKGLLRLAEDQSMELDQALGQNDAKRVSSAYQRIADAADECNDTAAHAGNCASSTKTAFHAGSEVHHPRLIDDPSNDCDILGLQHCQTQPLEYVAWASPFTPN